MRSVVFAAFGTLVSVTAAPSLASDLVSVNATGTDSSNAYSNAAALSESGRFVVFTSRSSDLGPTDTNGMDDVYVRDLDLGTTTLVSVNSAGTDSGNAYSYDPVISADGRFVAFVSRASDLGPTDTNSRLDVYVRDLSLGTTVLASANASGTDSGNATSYEPFLSSDGSVVAFASGANDLGPADTNGTYDVYARDLLSGTTSLLSVNAAQSDSGNSFSFNAILSADGRYAAFESFSSNLGPTDTNGMHDVYVRDLLLQQTSLVSINAQGTDSGNSFSYDPSFSADAQLLVFVSAASDLGPADTNGVHDVYVRNLTQGTTELVSVNSGGIDSGNQPSYDPVMAADGQSIAFVSYASDLGSLDTNGQADVYVRHLDWGTTELVSLDAAAADSGNAGSEEISISADGRFVAFTSFASDLVPQDTNQATDVFVRDLDLQLTLLASINALGTDSGDSYSDRPILSSDAHYLVFGSVAQDLGPTDTNGTGDAYITVVHEE